MTDVTHILSQIEQGNRLATEQLFSLVYDELRQLAATKLSHEKPDHTLQPTALVHEAYLRLVDVQQAGQWDSRRHFFGAAAEAMRRILVDSARRRQSQKRGGDLQRQAIEMERLAEMPDQQLLETNAALDQLEQEDSRAAEVVKLRFFAGLSVNQTGELLELSPRTVDRLWAFARAWLYREIQPE
jgi:RNA polymerase sigma factor (TIGR02999 family)